MSLTGATTREGFMMQVETVEKLVALLPGAIVEDKNRVVWQKQRADRWGNMWWHRPGSPAPFNESSIALPATLLAQGPSK